MPNNKWEDKFNKDWEEFTRLIKRTITTFNNNSKQEICSLCGVNAKELGINIKSFISSIRLQDKEELIKMLPEDRFGSYNECLEEIKQLIQDYYNK